ncbi:YbaB/EbfC family nucleoid-associated protein [uncultured Propionibacterium sp.]|uniref:YbaB/EbfC family nucleoid-associated protein n=1 Tax=uncultured Propionibacterium sp. TaxID=218066 RepID=UPI00293116EA|nr:YbaB/EbfC family nucleoid-associated protein [uncultured Propionibacterium sp.]
MFPEGMDVNALLEQAQQVQAQLQEAQHDLESTSFTGTAGGELVKATVKGNGELIGLVIRPEAIDPSDAEGLADLVLAAVRDAATRASAAARQAMPDLGQLGL